ncbi:hypothetical protein [Paraburkholderia sp. 32]|uniref:hypothetical protein n=1 Tax=Paraburkholderia sp. 32 TaxID=2991057 RepID=UPI003D19209E
MNQAVIEMDLFTQQNAALVEQAAAAAQSLEDQAAQLRIAVSSFRLTDAFGNGLRATDGVDTIAMR